VFEQRARVTRAKKRLARTAQPSVPVANQRQTMAQDAVPATMRTFVYGSGGSLKMDTAAPVPTHGRNQVLVKVRERAAVHRERVERLPGYP
jgi:hypothetical protein